MRPVRVMILEDEPVCRAGLARMLELEGCEVATAAGTREALQLGETFRPEVLLTDVTLNEPYDGVEVVRELLTDENFHPELIVISGLPRDEIERRLEGLRVNRILEKPLNLGDVMNAVGEIGCEGGPPAAEQPVPGADQGG